MRRNSALTGLLAGAALSLAAASAEPAKFSVDDLVRIANVSDLDLSPDGEYVVYSVGEPNFENRGSLDAQTFGVHLRTVRMPPERRRVESPDTALDGG